MVFIPIDSFLEGLESCLERFRRLVVNLKNNSTPNIRKLPRVYQIYIHI